MNIARKKKAWLILIAVLACLLLAVLCFKFILPQKVFISGSLVERSLEDLFSESALVVRGTVSEPSESLKIRSTSGSDAIYTDYKFGVSELLSKRQGSRLLSSPRSSAGTKSWARTPI